MKQIGVEQADFDSCVSQVQKERLMRVLEDRIAKADCVLVMSGMYCRHSEWIQSEIELANEYGKPVIGVKPRGQERIPQEVQRVAVEMVGWNTGSIVSAVRRHSKATPAEARSELPALYALALGYSPGRNV